MLKLIGIFSTVLFVCKLLKCGNIQNITRTFNEEPNILIYRTPSHLIICRSYKLRL